MDALTGCREDEPLIHGEGHTERHWLESPWLSSMTTVSLPGLLMGVRRLVVIAPHPDDEVLGCGGLMWTARRHGISVRIVSVTHGEACYPDHAPASIAETRHAELLAATAVLGVSDACVTALGYPDGQLQAQETQLEASLADAIAPGDLVLGTWEGDGHPDHEAAGRAGRAAAAGRGARYASYPIWAWHWLDLRDARRRLSGAVRFALPPDAARAKARAVAEFRSQLSGVAATGPILPRHVLVRFERDFEVYIP